MAAEDEAVSPEQRAAVMKTFKDDVTPFLKNYCMVCHGDKKSKEGDVSFNGVFGRPGAGEFRKVWQLAAVNVREHAMPPEDAKKQPTDEERKKFLDWIPQVRYLNPKDPGAFVIRRLNKVEYGNTLRDLLGVDPAVAKDLPDEVPGEGYLNNLSPAQTEQYLVIANQALNIALGPQDEPVTDKQKQLFGETPAAGGNLRDAAKVVAGSFARQAYRRPATTEELDVLLQVFDLGRENKLDYPSSLRLMVKAALVSPQFLFITPANEPPTKQSIVPLDDYQLASRLSYFLWSTMPDAELSALADRGKLNDPAILRAQAKRLLLDPRSQALFEGFGRNGSELAGSKKSSLMPKNFPR
ncbi:MAG: DUF1592 domain-containing protein [Pirellulales bacterium]